MMDFMREGGMPMWVMLVTALVAAGMAATKPAAARPAILVTGTLAVLIQGLLGMSTGLLMVAKHFQEHPNPAIVLGIGLGEASNDGIFGGVLATLLGVAALVSARQADAQR